MWVHVRKERKFTQNVLRHTYISMTVGSFRTTGNSESVIRKYYLDLVTTEEADRFWQIVPRGMNQFDKLNKIKRL